MRNFSVPEETHLQDFLFTALNDLKKTKIKQILKFGSVRVNGRVVTWYQHPLKAGDKIEILSKDRASAERSKSELGLKIVYEDNDLLVVEKPSGLLTMGTEREKEATLYFMLNQYERSKTKDESGRVFIVHRLDRDASGLIVFAKNDASKRALQGRWELATKKYYAITEGTPKEKSGTIENFLREDAFRRVYSVPKNHPEAQRAVTHYRLLRENGGYALLEVTLETGRKNQIRVHLSGLGYPIMGDEKYGAKSDPFRRLALHACFLSFPHPVTGELKSFKSALPAPFKKIFPTV
ncbi:MAG: RluA family pseudouridine synthase [Candidatus Omnitrophica bacterium]|nr:RluA family pseudouridine synthase [Candidatus Omnitrophota bacterium]